MNDSTKCIIEDRIEWRNAEGKFHCTDGPAIEYANGDKEWFLNGTRITEEEFNNFARKL